MLSYIDTHTEFLFFTFAERFVINVCYGQVLNAFKEENGLESGLDISVVIRKLTTYNINAKQVR